MGGRRDCHNGRWGTTFRALRWRSMDSCGLACMSLSAGIHLFALCTIANRFLSHSIAGIVLFIVAYIPSTVMALWSLYMAWSTDPGAVPIGARPLYHPSYEQPILPPPSTEDLESGRSVENSETPLSLPPTTDAEGSVPPSRVIHRCRKCNDNYKPPRSHHDSVTGRCIVKMDHFCPWVGNAIGALNHKFFILFVLYTFISCTATIPIVILQFVQCSHLLGQPRNNVQPSDPLYEDCQKLLAPQVMVLVVITILFFFFTLCMLADQFLAVTQNISKIARMKIEGGGGADSDQLLQLQRVSRDFNEIFGVRSGDRRTNQFQWHWLVPLPVQFPPGMKDVVLGYKYDASFPSNEPWWPPHDTDDRSPESIPQTNIDSIPTTIVQDEQVADDSLSNGGITTLTRRMTPSTLEVERLVHNNHM